MDTLLTTLLMIGLGWYLVSLLACLLTMVSANQPSYSSPLEQRVHDILLAPGAIGFWLPLMYVTERLQNSRRVR